MRTTSRLSLVFLALTTSCASIPAEEEPAGGTREISLRVGRDHETGCTYIMERQQQETSRPHSCNKLIVKGN